VKFATVTNVQQEDEGWHAVLNLEDGTGEPAQLLFDIYADLDASTICDIHPETHSVGISGLGKSPFTTGQQIEAGSADETKAV
jgi:hypothetical protein